MTEPRPLVRAPELDGGDVWFNTASPIRLADLRGKIVLLDFWTSCCINCIHVQSELCELERLHRDELVVIGVHSPKFPTERETTSLGRAVQRYGISHPVVNDPRMAIWESYAIKAWPTLVLVDPRGYIVGTASGEGHGAALDQAITRVAEIHSERGWLSKEPIQFQRRAEEGQALRFPGKILADSEGDRLFVSDSGHHRIVVATLKGEVVDVIGSGDKSDRSGGFDAASFNDPQGMAWDGQRLYVADTGNHLIRRCDLESRRVETVAGSGKQGHPFDPWRILPALKANMNSPWDLHWRDGNLFVAMAGSHQIWLFEVATMETGPYAGSGREGLHDGLLPECWLAQPSGLAGDASHLFVADSEVSAVRAIPLDPSRSVKTVVGLGLFQFGDQDGSGDKVRLQHPLGVAWNEGALFVADTYNHKIKTIDPGLRSCRTLFGNGKPGLADGKQPQFDQPGGLSVAGGSLFVADTNNHRVRRADLSALRVETMELRGL